MAATLGRLSEGVWPSGRHPGLDGVTVPAESARRGTPLAAAIVAAVLDAPIQTPGVSGLRDQVTAARARISGIVSR